MTIPGAHEERMFGGGGNKVQSRQTGCCDFRAVIGNIAPSARSSFLF